MEHSNPSSETEIVIRLARRNLVVILLMVLIFAATLLSSVFQPAAALSTWPSKAPWLIPMVIVLFVVISASGPRRLRPDSPEVKVMLADEWRRECLTRAMRVAFVVVLVSQVPQAFLFVNLPPLRALMGMAVTTISLALATLIALFLFFERDQSHE